MKSENLVHIKFEYENALKSKGDIISSEMDLIKILKSLRRYKELRLEELKIKEILERKLRSLKLDIGKLENLLPDIKMPKIIKSSHKNKKLKEKPIEVKTFVKEEPEDELETQLQEIQRKLRSLQA